MHIYQIKAGLLLEPTCVLILQGLGLMCWYVGVATRTSILDIENRLRPKFVLNFFEHCDWIRMSIKWFGMMKALEEWIYCRV